MCLLVGVFAMGSREPAVVAKVPWVTRFPSVSQLKSWLFSYAVAAGPVPLLCECVVTLFLEFAVELRVWMWVTVLIQTAWASLGASHVHL